MVGGPESWVESFWQGNVVGRGPEVGKSAVSVHLNNGWLEREGEGGTWAGLGGRQRPDHADQSDCVCSSDKGNGKPRSFLWS